MPHTTITPRILRPYQIEASNAVIDTWAAGINRTAVVLPTGAGKSTVAADIAVRAHRDFGLNVAIIAHRDLLLTQLSDAVAQVDPTLPPVGLVQAQHNETGARYVLTGLSVATFRDNVIAAGLSD